MILASTDLATIHPANPILADARASIERSKRSEAHPGIGMTSESAVHVAIAFGDDAMRHVPSLGVTLEHIDHARRVLARLVALRNTDDGECERSRMASQVPQRSSGLPNKVSPSLPK